MAVCGIPPALWDKLPFRGILHLLKAQHQQQMQDEAYRIYTTDTLKYICESVTQRLGGRCMAQRYVDFTDQRKPEQQESGDEIINRLGEKLDAMGGGDVSQVC